MGGQSCGMDKRQYQLLTNLETGFITLKVLADDPPTRLRRAASQLGVVLPKGMVQELSDGDTLSLPGARFVFEVRRRKKVDEDEDHPEPRMETVPPLRPPLGPPSLAGNSSWCGWLLSMRPLWDPSSRKRSPGLGRYLSRTCA